MKADPDRAKVALGEWLSLSAAERKRLLLPTSQEQFAQTWGISPRTVARWKHEDGLVAETLAQAQERRRAAVRFDLAMPLVRSDEEHRDQIEQTLRAIGRDDVEAWLAEQPTSPVAA